MTISYRRQLEGGEGRCRKVPHARVRLKKQDRATKGVTRAKQEVEIGAMGAKG